MMIATELARNLSLGDLFNAVRARFGAFEVVDHWQQGEFHHDLVRSRSTSNASWWLSDR